MKNTNLILVAIILAGVFYLSFTEKSPAKPQPSGQMEMMSIHQYVSLSGAVSLIVFNNGDMEEIEIEIPKGSIKEKTIAISKGIHEALDRYYDQGWELEGMLSEGRYVLAREK